jgi:uncharacterized protein YaiL (DUF2058 family)
MNSLRDQLLKVGLVTEQQAKQAAQQEQQRQFRNRPPKHNKDPRPQQGQHSGSGQHAGPGQRPNQGQPPGSGQHPQGRHQRGSGNSQAGQSYQPAPAIPRAPQHPAQSAATLAAQQAQAAKVARDQELNRKREEKAKRRAKLAEIEQIIEQNRVPRLETEDYYSFIDGKKIRRMSVDADRREKLTSGVLVVVRYKGHYAVVPKETADRIRERDENMVVATAQTKGSPATEAPAEDPYKDFVVPDDLMW